MIQLERLVTKVNFVVKIQDDTVKLVTKVNFVVKIQDDTVREASYQGEFCSKDTG